MAKLKKNVLVFASGNGSNFQAIVDACEKPRCPYTVKALITNVGGCYATEKATNAGLTTICVSNEMWPDRDRPQHKIYIQVIGNTSWQLFSHNDDLPDEHISITEEGEKKYLTEIMNFTMVPGDVLYMPPGQIHKVRNHNGPRISFSIPFIIDQENKIQRMDRSHIPLQEIFGLPTGNRTPVTRLRI